MATFPAEFIWESNTLAELYRLLIPGGRLYLLPIAWITGTGPLNTLARRLFEITGQSPAQDDDSVAVHAIQRLQEAGFSAASEIIQLKTSAILLIEAQKPAS